MSRSHRVGIPTMNGTGATGLILLSALDAPGLAYELFQTLAPFAISIVDVEQVVIDSRLILSVHIVLNPAHANAIEADLIECAQRIDADIAVAFKEEAAASVEAPQDLLFVTILGDPITPATLALVTQSLTEANANIQRISRGDNSTPSLLLQITGASLPTIRTSFSILAHEHGIEIAVYDAKFHSARKLIVLDVDSTLIEQEVIELLARRANAEEEVREITESAMRGEIDFEASLIARVGLLKGLPESVIEDVRADISLTPGAEILIKSLQSLGHCVGLVTGGFREILAPLIDQLGISHFAANSLQVIDGSLSGFTSGKIIDRAGKATMLRQFAQDENIPLEHTIAIGDGANDLDMMAIAGIGIAFNAKPTVRAQADSSITQKDLARVLALLGIPRLN